MKKLQKNEDTWYEMLGHSRCRVRFSSESIQWAVMWMAFHMILLNPNGNRYVLYLNWNGSKWYWDYAWLDNDWKSKHVSAELPEILFIFYSPCFELGEFFFIRLPLQPPKSLPMEFNLSESPIYFLSSIDLVSQRICRNIFKTSDLRIANLTYGIFSSGFKKAAIAIDSIISVRYLSTFCPSV